MYISNNVLFLFLLYVDHQNTKEYNYYLSERWYRVMEKIKLFCNKLYHEYTSLLVIGTYMIAYMIAFYFLENRSCFYFVVNFKLDAYIPFCEYFIVPYILWFPYVGLTVLWLCLKDKEESIHLVSFLILGMTVFIIISTLIPNGHNLRPHSFTRDNFFIDVIKKLYIIDTSTNVVPSIHVYNSLAIIISVWRTRLLNSHKIIRFILILLGVSIICSTVLIKQHSMLDVIVAFFLSAIFYPLSYMKEFPNKIHSSVLHNS